MLVFNGAAPYSVSDEDEVWLKRAVMAEGGPYEMVARALINLFGMVRATRGSSKTLAELIRSYAQPVNPRWFPEGDLLAASLLGKSEDEQEREREKAVERRDVHSTRTVFPPAVEEAVEAALQTSYPGDITDYASPLIDARGKGYEPRSRVVPGQNRFWTRKPGWAGYAVDTGESGSGDVLVALVVLAAAVALARRMS